MNEAIVLFCVTYGSLLLVLTAMFFLKEKENEDSNGSR